MVSAVEQEKVEQEKKVTRGQCLELSALMVKHNSGFGVMSKATIDFWRQEPGAAVIFAANALEKEFKRLNSWT